MDDKLKRLRDEYEAIEIPKELSEIVKSSTNGQRLDLQGEKKMANLKRKRIYRSIGTVAAAFVVLIGGFAVGVNNNEAFADSVQDIPVLGSLARVFTTQSVHEETDAYVTDMKIPGIDGLKDEKLQKEINQLVYEQVTAAVKETEVMMEEAKQAWLETGGKEEEYMQREISVDYEVKCLNEDILSFAVFKLQTLASAYEDLFYYNYDLKTSQPLTLKSLLGEDYINIVNEQVKAGIEERSKIEGNMFFNGEEGVDGFSTITDEQQFYVNEKGNPVIVFNKYEIAPGYMGIQEFEILK